MECVECVECVESREFKWVLDLSSGLKFTFYYRQAGKKILIPKYSVPEIVMI